ncbi:hypothetical protein Hanom_Chr07g00604771 [Helianthus anomalus]
MLINGYKNYIKSHVFLPSSIIFGFPVSFDELIQFFCCQGIRMCACIFVKYLFKLGINKP